ncbi:hypothetical protein [Gordonia sp. CPCC 205333]|uniref:hypothetical protein n=1 Tax=Gordonia sp. CPCC 205333 TaxID=3140790 RepID=UPI003AF33DD2
MTDVDPPAQGDPNPVQPWIAPSAGPAMHPLESGIPPGWAPVDPVSDAVDYGLAHPAEIYGYRPPPTYANPLVAHKPGIIPLRPLGLGDILGGALTAITTNLRAVAAISAVIAVASALITLLGSVLMDAVSLDDDNVVAALGGITTLSIAASVVLTSILTGALAYPTSRAVEGRYPPLSRCWERLAPRIPAVLAVGAIEFVIITVPLMLVTAIFATAGAASTSALAVLGLLVILIAVVALTVVTTFIAFALPITVLEKLGPIDSLRRSVALVRPVFWRVFGILLLVGLIIGIAGSVITSPAEFVGSVTEEVAGGASATTTKLATSTILSAVADFITLPFLATTVTLLYTDTRIRLEGFDITLIAASADSPKGNR